MKSSWEARSLEAWYIGPTWDHCRCLQFQVPTTGGICVSSQYKLYPQHSHVPIETPRDEATRIARQLIEAVKGLQDQEKNHQGRHTQALETLKMFFKDTVETFPERTPPQTQTSTNSTQLRALRTTPRNHQRLTQANTPGLIPAPVKNHITKTSEF